MAHQDANQEDTTTNARITAAEWEVIRTAMRREAHFATQEGWLSHAMRCEEIVRKIDVRGD